MTGASDHTTDRPALTADATTGPARPSAADRSADAGVVIAVDVGGTGIKAGLMDAAGGIRDMLRRPTGAQHGPDAVVRTIIAVAQGLAATAAAAGAAVHAAGVVVPGVVDERHGVARWSANVGFRDVPLRDLVRDALGVPVVLGHDVRAGGLAEARLGAGRGYGQVLFLAVGTGIAAAYIVDGRVLSGAHHCAGEIGHVVVAPDGPPCNCGARGCLETVASASALARAYSATMSTVDGVSGAVTAGGLTAGAVTAGAVTAAEVVGLAGAGDPVAGTVWAATVDALAAGLHTAVCLYDPDVVVIGGGLAEAGAALFEPLDRALRARLTFQAAPRLLPAELGDWAGCLGAGLRATSAAPQR